MKNTFVSVKEAALKLGMKKGEVRNLIKKNMIDYKLKNRTYVVNVRSVRRIVYKPIPIEVRQMTTVMVQHNLPTLSDTIPKVINGVKYVEYVIIDRIGMFDFRVIRYNRFGHVFDFKLHFKENWNLSEKIKSRIKLSPNKCISFDELVEKIADSNKLDRSVDHRFLFETSKMKFEMLMTKNVLTSEDLSRLMKKHNSEMENIPS